MTFFYSLFVEPHLDSFLALLIKLIALSKLDPTALYEWMVGRGLYPSILCHYVFRLQCRTGDLRQAGSTPLVHDFNYSLYSL